MSLIDVAGFLAGTCVILAFYCKGARPLRGFAIASNLLFIFYAVAQDLAPIAILHIVLLPLNVLRLQEALGRRAPTRPAPPPFPQANASRSPFEQAMSAAISTR